MVLALGSIVALGSLTIAYGQATKGSRQTAPPASPKGKPATPATDAPAPSTIQAKKVERVDIVNPQTVQEFEKKDRIAVIAAVGRYGEDLPPLQFTMADAVELTAEFKRQGYTVFNLLNNEATADNIRQRLEAIAGQIQPQDGTVVFVFSGHGFQSGDGKNFLATYGTTVDTLQERGLSLTEVEGLMKRSGARRSVLFVDACRNVPGEKGSRKAPRSFDSFSDAEGVRILLSTRPGGFSYEDSALQHGIFTHFLLEGLRGKATGTDGKITFDDLSSYVESKVFAYSSQKGFIQKPFHSGEGHGDFLVATGTPLKEEEVVKAKEESGSKNITNDSVLAKRQGTNDSFMMVSKENTLYLYHAPSMQPFASLTLKPATGLNADQKRFDGTAGTGNQTIQAVVRFDGNMPTELDGRIGVPCQANCTGQDVRLPGETQSVSSAAKRTETVSDKAAGFVDSIWKRGKGQQAANTTKKASETVQASNGMSWTMFKLIPDQKLKQ
jgi:hypothetical protein